MHSYDCPPLLLCLHSFGPASVMQSVLLIYLHALHSAHFFSPALSFAGVSGGTAHLLIFSGLICIFPNKKRKKGKRMYFSLQNSFFLALSAVILQTHCSFNLCCPADTLLISYSLSLRLRGAFCLYLRGITSLFPTNTAVQTEPIWKATAKIIFHSLLYPPMSSPFFQWNSIIPFTCKTLCSLLNLACSPSLAKCTTDEPPTCCQPVDRFQTFTLFFFATF